MKSLDPRAAASGRATRVKLGLGTTLDVQISELRIGAVLGELVRRELLRLGEVEIVSGLRADLLERVRGRDLKA